MNQQYSPEVAEALRAIELSNRSNSWNPAAASGGSGADWRRRTRWTGPMPNRPVIDGKVMVTAEELADFRRQFGAEKTLRDLLNADRGAMPSAAQETDMRSRSYRNPVENYPVEGYKPAVAGEIPVGAMPGPAASGRIPGEVERNLINALMAISPMLGGMPAGVFARNALAQAPVAPVPVGMAAQLVRDPRTGLPMQLPRPAQVIRDPRTRAPMQLPEAYIPGVTR